MSTHTADDLLGRSVTFSRELCALVNFKSATRFSPRTVYTVIAFEPFDPRTRTAAHYVLVDPARHYRILLSSEQIDSLIITSQLSLF